MPLLLIGLVCALSIWPDNRFVHPYVVSRNTTRAFIRDSQFYIDAKMSSKSELKKFESEESSTRQVFWFHMQIGRM